MKSVYLRVRAHKQCDEINTLHTRAIVCISQCMHVAIGFMKLTAKYTLHIVNMITSCGCMYFRLSTHCVHVVYVYVCMNQPQETEISPYLCSTCTVYTGFVYSIHACTVYVCMYVL